ncbi:GtrA family protein [Hoeflea prorocentri]|uniref:GtrA family protein n=1 Tax=Hoeflea prorocentri TaxID=1922333 RepID=A0A9X3UFS8_9HYPH|nr:GtrA family protein [Hoeflea prorocentri]MCY6380003.1 GtrA family protein [Hoeflea prorocentri]MDA5397803.1 GtrA family protein [Hoeflea prorocentri]
MISRSPQISISHAALGELVRFAVVGVTVAALYFVLFVCLSQTRLPDFVINLVAFCTAVVVQYFLQAKWTFKRSAAKTAQAGKFIVTVGFGLLLSTLISSVIGPAMHWSSVVTAAVVVVILPISNFILFKVWVFALK